MDDLDTRTRRRLPSASMLVAMLALLVSLGGTATAAHLLITSRDIKDGTIQRADLSSHTKASLHKPAKAADQAQAL